MKELIEEKLREIERTENVRILHAVESGSRAWGFASRDSDYDVRFIYVRPWEHYMKLDGTRDVIELPINEELDINGWDLKKTLQLLYKTNPALMDWLASPIVYRQTDFAERLRPLMLRYFSPQKGVLHYLRMAERNTRVYLSDDTVRAKKYFYVLRPVLACRWILERKTPPPMLFSELVASQLDAEMKSLVEELLELKMNSPEVREIPRIDALNLYLERSMADIRAVVSQAAPSESLGWEPLNELFRSIVMGG